MYFFFSFSVNNKKSFSSNFLSQFSKIIEYNYSLESTLNQFLISPSLVFKISIFPRININSHVMLYNKSGNIFNEAASGFLSFCSLMIK